MDYLLHKLLFLLLLGLILNVAASKLNPDIRGK
jgi:hypothetical protein